MPRALAAAALAAAAVAVPAPAAPASEVDLGWRVSTSVTDGLRQIDATCHFVPERWVADYGNTQVRAIATTTGAVTTSVRCELVWDGYDRGDTTWTQAGPVLVAEDRFSYVSDTGVRICVSAVAGFVAVDAPPYVAAPRHCVDV